MSAFNNVIDSIPQEYKNLIKKGILVFPINIFFTQYPNLKDTLINHIFSNMKASINNRLHAIEDTGNTLSLSAKDNRESFAHRNTMHKYTSTVPISEKDINGINNILWSFVREYYELWDNDIPSYHGGFSLIYNKDYEKNLKYHIDDSLYTINMCMRNDNIEGSEIIFDRSKPNCYNKTYYNNKIFVPCKEDYMIIHLGNHPHQTNELISGERVNIILWFK